MNHTQPDIRRRPVLHFTRHAVEMILAMVAGMIVLEPVWSFVWPDLGKSMTAHVLVMVTSMSLGMALWMRIRRRGWVPIAEMAAATGLPFLAILPFYWTGLVSGSTVMMAGHILMVPAMLVAMFLRRSEYGA
jgi:hypothetical protein